eukprot:1148863-Pelagomonas_calceolata.AAC.10
MSVLCGGALQESLNFSDDEHAAGLSIKLLDIRCFSLTTVSACLQETAFKKFLLFISALKGQSR